MVGGKSGLEVGWNYALMKKGLKPMMEAVTDNMKSWNYALMKKGLKRKKMRPIVVISGWNYVSIKKLSANVVCK